MKEHRNFTDHEEIRNIITEEKYYEIRNERSETRQALIVKVGNILGMRFGQLRTRYWITKVLKNGETFEIQVFTKKDKEGYRVDSMTAVIGKDNRAIEYFNLIEIANDYPEVEKKQAEEDPIANTFDPIAKTVRDLKEKIAKMEAEEARKNELVAELEAMGYKVILRKA